MGDKEFTINAPLSGTFYRSPSPAGSADENDTLSVDPEAMVLPLPYAAFFCSESDRELVMHHAEPWCKGAVAHQTPASQDLVRRSCRDT